MRCHLNAICFSFLPCPVLGAGNLVDGPDADLVYDPVTRGLWGDASDTEGMGFSFYRLESESQFVNSNDYRIPFPVACYSTGGCEFTRSSLSESSPLLMLALFGTSVRFSLLVWIWCS